MNYWKALRPLLVYSSALSTDGAVSSSGQDLEHVDMVVNPPPASLKANTERIFANMSYAVNFIRIRIRRIRIWISKFVFVFGEYCERFPCSYSSNIRANTNTNLFDEYTAIPGHRSAGISVQQTEQQAVRQSTREGR
jgi:hypothetical protein